MVIWKRQHRKESNGTVRWQWGGVTELWLEARQREARFLAIDNAPYSENLNQVVKEMGLTNISFRRLDLRDASLGQFDVVFFITS